MDRDTSITLACILVMLFGFGIALVILVFWMITIIDWVYL